MPSRKECIAIVGTGPAGCMSAYFASKDADVTLFDSANPLHTILYTGGGRCNLAYAEYDFKELAKFYPRGEKFLYSVFSKFSTQHTIDFFKEIDIDTYIQDDLRVFPISNSAKEVREKFLNKLKNCTFKKERVLNIIKKEGIFLISTDKSNYTFDKIIIATGGHAGFSIAKNLGHKIIEPKPALTGFITKEDFKSIQGVSLKDVNAEIFYCGKKSPPIQGDILFTHEGISGPLPYKISSIYARENYSKKSPIKIRLDFLSLNSRLSLFTSVAFQNMLNSNPKKDIKNLIAELVPKSLAEYILNINQIPLDKKCCDINGKTRDLILKSLQEFEINAISSTKEGEIVTSGGVCLNEINPKTMQSKIVEGLYFCGEIINIDGFCGGFNLQNCWSTGFIAGSHA